MLVSAKEMLEKAVEGHYAVGQFNINNLGVDKIHPSDSRGAEISRDPGRVRGRRKIYDRFSRQLLPW